MSNSWSVRCEDGSGDEFGVEESIDPLTSRYVITVVRRVKATNETNRVVQLIDGEGVMLGLMLMEASRAMGERKAKVDRSAKLSEARAREQITAHGELNRQSHNNEAAEADEQLGRKRKRARKGLAPVGTKTETGAIVHGVLAVGTEHATVEGQTHVWFRMLGRFDAGTSVLAMLCRVCAKITLTKSTRETACAECGAPGTAFAGVVVDHPQEKAEADGAV